MATTVTSVGFGFIAGLIFVGCSTSQPVYKNGVCEKLPAEKVYIDVNTGAKIIENYRIYTPDVNLKEATAILIHKVQVLEGKVAALQNCCNQNIVSNTTASLERVKESDISNIAPIAINEVSTPSGVCPSLVRSKKTTLYRSTYRAILGDAYIYSCASKTSQVMKHIQIGERIKIERCDNFGWCTLSGQKGYIQKYKFSK